MRDGVFLREIQLFRYAVVFERKRDVHLLIQLLDRFLIGNHQLRLCPAGKPQHASEVCVAREARFLIELDHIRHKDRIRAAVGDVEDRADLVGQRVRDAQKPIGESHAGQTLGDMHLVASCRVAMVRLHDAVKNIGHRLLRQRIGEAIGKFGNIRLCGVGQRVHAGVGCQSLRHSKRNIEIQDCQIRRQIEIRQWILDAGGVIGDDRERRHLRRRAGRGRDGHKDRLLTQRRQRERLLDIIKSQRRIFIENPHSLRCIDRRTATDSHDHIRLKLLHQLRALLHFLDGRIRRNAVHDIGLKPCIMEHLLRLRQEPAAPHRAPAGADESLLAALQRRQLRNGPMTTIQISWQCETDHNQFLLLMKKSPLFSFLCLRP